MQLFIKLKQAGKRRLVLEKHPIEIAEIGNSPSLQALIEAVVSQQVTAYNAKTLEQPLIHFLTDTQIEEAATTGKVGFGTIYNNKKADLTKAIQVAIEAHIDGLFVVAVDDKIVEKLDTFIVLHPNTVITFIRLTLLIGR
jgi:hypothetical protein